MRHKLTVILFSLILIGPFVGTYCWLQYQKVVTRKQVKKQIFAGLDETSLILLKFTKEEAKIKLKWEDSKEFEFNDQMFDIVKTQIHNDSVYYWCWCDKKETKLNKELKKLVNQALGNNDQKKKNQERLLRFSQILYVQELFDWSVPSPGKPDRQFSLYLNLYSSLFLSPLTPPPRSFS